MTKREFIEKLASELSYDGNPDTLCPHCGKEIRKGYFWLDHRSSLAYNILRMLELPVFLRDAVLGDFEEALGRISITGSEAEDAAKITDWLVENLKISFDAEE